MVPGNSGYEQQCSYVERASGVTTAVPGTSTPKFSKYE